MAYGDPKYDFIAAGSTATSADTAHLFFGSYGGLSLLNSDDAVHLQVMSDGNEFRIGEAGYTSNNYGYKVFPAASWIDLPPMRPATASQLLFANANAGSNASANWVVWTRIP